MSVQNAGLKCSGCGGALNPTEARCKFCGNAVVITSFNSVYDKTPQELKQIANNYRKDLAANPNDPDTASINFSLGMCYLKLKLYDKAQEKFEVAIEDDFDNSETYFLIAVCLMKGKKAFLTPMANIKKALEYLDSALMIENNGIYNYFVAYLKYDFYSRKSLKISPTYQAELEAAKQNNVSLFDIDQLFEMLGVDKPEQLVF